MLKKSTSNIRPTGIMAGVDPFSWRRISKQRERLDRDRAERDGVPVSTVRHNPSRRPFSAAFRRLIAGHRTTNRDLPPPVSVFAGRFEAAIIWREDIETFAAYLTDTNWAGQLEARWIGLSPAQYPTIHSLAEALDAFGIGLDPGSRNLAEAYQTDVWAVAGACAIAGIRGVGGRWLLAAVTPHGQAQPMAPSPERDRRSWPFGPTVPDCTWGENGSRGALETARIVLDYVDSTIRSDQRLFHDGREFAMNVVRQWPLQFSVSVAEVQSWSHHRSRVVHGTWGPAVDSLRWHLVAHPSADATVSQQRYLTATGRASDRPTSGPAQERWLPGGTRRPDRPAGCRQPAAPGRLKGLSDPQSNWFGQSR